MPSKRPAPKGKPKRKPSRASLSRQGAGPWREFRWSDHNGIILLGRWDWKVDPGNECVGIEIAGKPDGEPQAHHMIVDLDTALDLWDQLGEAIAAARGRASKGGKRRPEDDGSK